MSNVTVVFSQKNGKSVVEPETPAKMYINNGDRFVFNNTRDCDVTLEFKREVLEGLTDTGAGYYWALVEKGQPRSFRVIDATPTKKGDRYRIRCDKEVVGKEPGPDESQEITILINGDDPHLIIE
jgi:hypothetical protein